MEFSDRIFALSERKTFGLKERKLFAQFRAQLASGEIRAAERLPTGQWHVNAWVKLGIIAGFRMGVVTEMSVDKTFRFFDKDTMPTRHTRVKEKVRIVPGGSSVRDGAYLAPGVVCMPPMFVNIGAYIDEGSMVDSHALVGSCAQIGKRVHLSAAAQIGGVLEPVGALPVIIEDDVMVGGGCGVYEGTVVRERAVLAPGTILTGSTPVYDTVNDVVYKRPKGGVLEIPAGAVVVPGSRKIDRGMGADMGLSLYAPIIVKYRDARTDAATSLEEALR